MKKIVAVFLALLLALCAGFAFAVEPNVEDEIYLRNADGETYGSSFRDAEENPELVLAENDEGVVGYIRESEIGGASINIPEEAASYTPQDSYINMYLEDGITVVGKFFVSKGSKNDMEEKMS